MLFSGVSGSWVAAGLGRALGLEVAVLTSRGVGASVSKTATVVGGEGAAGVVARAVAAVVSGRGRSLRMPVVLMTEVGAVEGGAAGMLGTALAAVAGTKAAVGAPVVVAVVVAVGVEMVVALWLGSSGTSVTTGRLVAGSGVGRSEGSSSNGVPTGWMSTVGSTAGVVGTARATSVLNRMAVSMPDSCSKSGGQGEESARDLGDCEGHGQEGPRRGMAAKMRGSQPSLCTIFPGKMRERRKAVWPRVTSWLMAGGCSPTPLCLAKNSARGPPLPGSLP